MIFADHLTLDAPRRTADGYLAVRAKAARVGVYQYSGTEVDPDNSHGLRDQVSVNVLRDAAQVFDARSLGSFVGKPITDDHPTEGVNASNWRDHARGVIMGAVKDGDHVGFDLAFLDGATIAKVDAGKVELSNGYSCKLEFGDFQAADGTKCAARQTNITGNHIALVDRGRAGASCRVGDAAICDSLPSNIITNINDGESIVTTKTITFDGLPLLVTDAAEAAINKQAAVITTLTGDKAGLEAKAVTDAAAIVAKDAEIVKLTADLAAAKLTPAQMRDAAKVYGQVVAKAKASGINVTDAMGEDEIKKAVVDKAMPGNTYTADHIAIAFDALTKDVKVTDAATNIVPIGAPVVLGDAATREQAALTTANDHNAWRRAGAAA
ncbi:DUF2213 domain-containing protein [Sphingomonas sp. PB4P5]|uniref:DUF2213 domain-containing protein n=1 Tax=Parasphingomonas puruogangriensis TaxID=3096155 RepID=UPI002FC72531